MNIRRTLSGLLQTGLGMLTAATLSSCAAATSGVMSNGSGSEIRRPAAASTSAPAALYTAAQAKRGERVYKEQCVNCHLDDLLGDDCAPPLAGQYFSAKWDGRAVGDIYEIMRTSMPIGAPSLSPQQYVDIISYVMNFNGMPEGTTELSIEPEKLSAVKFQLAKSH